MEDPFRKSREKGVLFGERRLNCINFALVSKTRIIDIIISLNHVHMEKLKKSKETFLSSNQTFVCTEDTNWPELVAFIFRVILHKRGLPFFLIKVENLTFEFQTKLLAKIQELKKKDKQIQLYIISTNPNSKIYEHFKDAKNSQFFYDKDCMKLEDIQDLLRDQVNV